MDSADLACNPSPVGKLKSLARVSHLSMEPCPVTDYSIIRAKSGASSRPDRRSDDEAPSPGRREFRIYEACPARGVHISSPRFRRPGLSNAQKPHRSLEREGRPEIRALLSHKSPDDSSAISCQIDELSDSVSEDVIGKAFQFPALSHVSNKRLDDRANATIYSLTRRAFQVRSRPMDLSTRASFPSNSSTSIGATHVSSYACHSRGAPGLDVRISRPVPGLPATSVRDRVTEHPCIHSSCAVWKICSDQKVVPNLPRRASFESLSERIIANPLTCGYSPSGEMWSCLSLESIGIDSTIFRSPPRYGAGLSEFLLGPTRDMATNAVDQPGNLTVRSNSAPIGISPRRMPPRRIQFDTTSGKPG